jgi:hypothetical protein
MTVSRITLPILAPVTRKTTDAINNSSTIGCENQAAKKHRMDTRHVQFAATSNLSIKAQYIDPSYELTAEICNDTWWSMEEREESGMERHHLAHEFRGSEKGETVDEGFKILYENCSVMSISQIMRTKAVKNVLVEVVSNDGLRGLESKLSKTVSKHRKNHVHSVLSLRVAGASDETLSVNSKQSSRASEILAHAIGILDARVAS